jgi:hypothetical protein
VVEMSINQLPVMLPSDELFGPVVQLYIGDRPFLRGGGEDSTHAEVLELALREFELEFETRKGRYASTIPCSEGQGYRVAGMAVATMLPGSAILSGDSTEYGIGICRQHLTEIQPLTDIQLKYQD